MKFSNLLDRMFTEMFFFFLILDLEFTYLVKIEFSIGERKMSKNFSNRFEIKIS